MGDICYWIAFKINEPGCSYVVEGPYTYDEALIARKKMKARSRVLSDLITVPFIADDEKDAMEKAKCF